MSKTVVQPKAAPYSKGGALRGRNRPRLDGKRRTPASPAVAAGEGAERLPIRKRMLYQEIKSIALAVSIQ